MQFFALLLCSALVALGAAHRGPRKANSVIVTAPVGRIRGSFNTTRLGKRIYSFRGVRFAEPPVGERRFKAPEPIAPWDDVFDATQEGPSCPQPFGQIQSEDCLRLNVYTTKLTSRSKGGKVTNPKRPVIVYFHPGAFYYFTSQSSNVGPRYMLDQDVVLVTVNNRLGVLGFTATGDSLAPGNNAFKDQVVALKWVKDNIASFGGDPDSVTICGYSAGSWSVALHLVSPMTKGLFHRAIAMSGSPVYVPLPTEQKDLAIKAAQIFNCPTDTTAKILDCLRTKDAIEIGGSLNEFFTWNGNPGVLWAPVVEPDIPGVERYLPAQPADLIKQGKMHDVPFILGVTKDEYAGTVIPIVMEARKGNTTIFDEYNSRWYELSPLVYGYDQNTPRSREISDSIKQYYFQGQPLSMKNIDSLAQSFRDSLIIGIHKLVTLYGQHARTPVYYYEFTYQGRYSFSSWPDTKKPYGVCHHDDLLYLFDNKFIPRWEEGDREIEMVEKYTSMWAHFAKTGEPIPPDNPRLAGVTWTPYTPQNKAYLQIGEELVMKANLYKEPMDKWVSLLPFPLEPESTSTKGSSTKG